MATQLIPVFHGTINNEPTLLCNARDLHAFLGVGKVFAAWMVNRIEEYGLVENQDYIITFSKTGKRQNVRCKDYHLTLDTAKELAMVERNEKGREVRRYFIECEKQLLKTASAITVATPAVTPQEIDAYNVDALAKHFRVLLEAWREQIYPALRKLESPLAGRLVDRFTDGAIFLSRIEKSAHARLQSGQKPRLQ